MAPIRVLRVIEYEYNDVERMVNDMQRWTYTAEYGGMRIKTAVFPPSLPVEDSDDS